MTSIIEAMDLLDPPVRDVVQMRVRLGEHTPPFSLKHLIDAAHAAHDAESRTFQGTVRTPAGTALGGQVELTIKANGDYIFKVDMHDTGLDPYAFTVAAFLNGGLFTLAMMKSGNVGGAIGRGATNFHWTESGSNSDIALRWNELKNGSFAVHKSYRDTGLLGVLKDIGEVFLGFLAANLVAGPQIGGLLFLGAELTQRGILPSPSPAMVGVAVAGGVFLLLGPGAAIPAVASGALIGGSFSTRRAHPDEVAVIESVFAGTIDWSNVWITDLHHPTDQNRNRAFTTIMPVSGDIYVSVGDNFATMADGLPLQTTLVHEFTHVWQIQHRTFDAKAIWQAAFNDILYSGREEYRFVDTDKWSDMNIEAQASAIATWYALFVNWPDEGLKSLMATSSPLFSYVSQNIRLGRG